MIVDMKGKRFGNLVVVKRLRNDKYGNAMWDCVCDCGNSYTAKGQSLRNGHVKSCGCLQRKTAQKLSYIHGESRTILYKRWHAMKQRCENKNSSSYKDYGGRGIKICDEWKDFMVFKEWAINNGYKKELTIERVDVNGDYSPKNCVFATRAEQNRNTRRNIRILVNGKIKTISEIARDLDIPKWVLLTEYHNVGKSEFLEKYHLNGGIPADKTICKIYGLRSK